MSVTMVTVLLVAAALVAVGALTAAWRRDLTAGLAGIPLMLGGAAVAFAGVARFSAASGPALLGQEFGVLLAVAALALTALGIGVAGREGSR